MIGRCWLLLLSLFARAAVAAVPPPSVPAPVTDVAIEGGSVRGSVEGEVVSWRGIPFAAPPVGGLRWRAPRPPAPWQGVLATTAFRNDCMQYPFEGEAAPAGAPPAEDCLYANVWRPARATAKLPVLLWIYGGGFVNGGASPPVFSGANLARQGLLYVSFNYRLGRFGTFAHPQLTKENADDGLLGNYGYMDQLAALRWVHRNIAAFGGDAANITVIGESAGGFSIHMLLTSPMATGMVQRAVIMSGGDGKPYGPGGIKSAEGIGLLFAASKGILPFDPQSLAKLRAMSADAVTDGLNMMDLFKLAPRTFSSPFVDGMLAVDQPAAYRAGAFAHVPIMIGATSADIGGTKGPMVAGARSMAATFADNGVPVYRYRFSYVAESIGHGGATHASDVPFFLDTTAAQYGDKTTGRDRDMARAISAYVANFAKTGDPNGAGLPPWPRYSRDGGQIMEFAADGLAEPRTEPATAR